MAQLELRRQALDLAASEAHALSTVTERRRAEEALREQSVQLDAALGVARMDVWFGNLQTGEVFGRIRRGGPVSRLPRPSTPSTSAGFMRSSTRRSRRGRPPGWRGPPAMAPTRPSSASCCPTARCAGCRRAAAASRTRPAQPPSITGVDLDITERKRDEERIEHLNRVYAVLSDINQAIVREPDLDASCSPPAASRSSAAASAWRGSGLLDPATGRLTRRAAGRRRRGDAQQSSTS